MKNKFPAKGLIIALILALGIFLRLWNLDKVPVSLFGDEIDVGLQANSILATGKDYMGHALPVMFRSFAEYRLPMQLYMSVPFVKIFGLNELGVRGASALMGFFSLIGMYFFTRELFGKKISLIATILFLFSPWHLIFARQANDAGFLLPFTLFGTLLFVKGLKEYKYLLYTAVVWGLGVYSYATYTLFAPIFVFVLAMLFFRQIKRYSIIKLALAASLGLLIISPYLYESLGGTTTERISVIRLIPHDELEGKIVRERLWAGNFWGRAFYNKYTITGGELFKNYTRAFSPEFLFAQGDINPRHNVGGYGQMYQFEFLTVLLGIYASIKALKSKNKRYYLLFILWFVIAPIPSMLTYGGGTHASRLILMIVPLIIFSSLGINYILNVKKSYIKNILVFVLLIVSVFSVSKFMHRYFVNWPNQSWRFWHYGFKDTLSFVKSIDADYEKIYFNNTYEPMLPRFLFYYGYDMSAFQREFTGDIHIENLKEGFDGFKLGDKYYFGDLKKPIEKLADPKVLVVASGEKDVSNPGIFDKPDLELIEIYKSPYGDDIFYVFTGN